MKIIGFGNCTKLRKYVDEIILKNLSKEQSNYYSNRVRKCIIPLLKFKLIHEDYSLIKFKDRDISDIGLLPVILPLTLLTNNTTLALFKCGQFNSY